MNPLAKAIQAIPKFFKTKNSADDGMALASQFLRYGNRRQLVANWARLSMSDQDMYTGYFFGATNKRANGVVELSENNIKTRAAKAIMDQAKAKKQDVIHPYLAVIDMSEMQNDDFYYNYSTYMDLEGVCYLFVLRNIARKSDGSVAFLGAPQAFKLISPYNITPIRDNATGEVAGYQEYKGGLVRDLPPEMVIPIRRLNPFSETEPFGIADAAKDSQFMLKSAADYTNNAVNNNINSPGIISTGVELPQPLFENFRQRILSHEKGEPLFGNGSGKLDWNAMQTELEKAALDKINEIGLMGIIASTGVSKTSLGIEQSGTTRDTSDVQHDQLISDHVMPQLRKFLNALNQDYRNYYPNEYKKTQYTLFIDNPLGSDREAEQMDVTIRQTAFTLYTEILAEGYTTDLAAKYASGEIALEDLGEPTNKPEPQDIQPEVDKPTPEAQVDVPDNEEDTPPADKTDTKDTKAKKAKKDKKQSQDNSYQAKLLIDINYPDKEKGNPVSNNTPESHIEAPINHEPTIARTTNTNTEIIKNDPVMEPSFEPVINSTQIIGNPAVLQHEGALKNIIVQIQQRLISAVLNKVAENAYDKQSDIVDQQDKAEAISTLVLALTGFYTSVMPLVGAQMIRKRIAEFVKLGVTASPTFTFDKSVRNYIAEAAEKAAGSHIDTVLDDVLEAVRKVAVEGVSRDQIIQAIKTEFTNVSKTRADLIAKTESYRAINRSQYDADRQFLDDVGKRDVAMKKWAVHSDSPCAFCQAKADEPPIPFDEPFADIGDNISANVQLKDGSTSTRVLPITYETIQSGGLHPRCECDYELIIPGGQ